MRFMKLSDSVAKLVATAPGWKAALEMPREL
jgi:hypothetical protein